MICSKCNSEIPNGSRFCPVCGAECEAAAPAAAEQKNVCTKCGQELKVGAKFCPGCGNSVSAVSLNKEPNANDLVAKMNAAAAAVPTAPAPTPTPTPIPTPTPAPTFSGVPTPTTPAAGYNSGFSAPTPGVAPSMPQAPTYAPYGNGAAPMGGAFNGMNGAAAVVAAPVKKKVSAGKIVLIIAIVLAVLLGGVAAFFFTNKATAMSILMGKPKYAAMIEKDSLKKSIDKLDTAALSDQIKSASGVMSAFMVTATDVMDAPPSEWLSLSGAGTDPKLVPLMAVTDLDSFEGIDVKAILKGYNELMQSTYGKNSISGSLSAKVKLGKNFEDYDDEDLNKVLELINNCEFTYDCASTEKLMGTEFGVKLNGKTLDMRIIIEEDGSTYFLFPFASDTALKYKIATVDSPTVTLDHSIALELDAKELERLINEIVDIYSGYIKNSSVTMEKGSMNVAGNVIEGKEIIADINGKNLENLIKEVFEHIANDKYFSGKIVEFINNFDEDFTESDYKNAIKDIVNEMDEISEDDKLIVTMIVSNSGKLLAKSYTVAGEGQRLATLAYAESDAVDAVDFKVFNQTVASFTNEKTNDKDGKITFKIGYGTFGSLGMVIDYTGVDTADFGKTVVPVGSYSVKFDTSKLGMMGIEEEIIDMLKSFALKFSTAVSGDTANCSFTLSVRDYIDLDLSADMKLSDDVSKYSVPSNVIDLTPMIETEDISDADMEKLMTYFEELSKGLSGVVEGTMFEDIFEDIIYHITPSNFDQPEITPSRPVDEPTNSDTYYNDAEELYMAIENEWDDFVYWVEGEYEWLNDDDLFSEFENSPAFDLVMNYMNDLLDLDDELWDAIYENDQAMTKAQLDEYNKRFSNILKRRADVKVALDNYFPSQLTGMGPVA